MHRVMVVEDEGIVARDLQNSLEDLGYSVVDVLSTGEDAILKAGELRPDIVLMDIMLRGNVDGVTATSEIQGKYDIPVVYITSHSDIATVDRVKRTQPFGYIVKPFRHGELKSVIEIALYRHQRSLIRKRKEDSQLKLLSSLSAGVVVFDDDFTVTYINSAANEITGGKEDYYRGRKIDELFAVGSDDDSASCVIEKLSGIISGAEGCIKSENFMIRTRNNELKKAYVDIIRVTGKSEKSDRFVILFNIHSDNLAFEYPGYTEEMIIVGSTLFREGIKGILDPIKGLSVAGELSRSEGLLALLSDTEAGLLLIEETAADEKVTTLVKKINETHPGLSIAVIIHDFDIKVVWELLYSGVLGIASASTDTTEFISGIFSVMKSSLWIDKNTLSALLDAGSDIKGINGHTFDGSVLTTREREIIDLILSGRTNNQIAEILCLSVNTVKNHLRNMYEKLDVKNRIDLLSRYGNTR